MNGRGFIALVPNEMECTMVEIGDTVHVGGRGTGRLLGYVGNNALVKLPSGKITQSNKRNVRKVEG